MVPVSREIKEEPYKFEPVSFVSAYKVKDGTDNTPPTLSYKDDIDTIHQVSYIIYQKIVIGNTFLLPSG